MQHHLSSLFCFCAMLLAGAATAAPTLASAKVSDIALLAPDVAQPVAIKGCGGAYFLAEPGVLRITLTKRETSPRAQPVRAVLATPDRQTVADVWLPGLADSGAAVQSVTIEYDVTAAGVFALSLTAPDDRYGNRFQWMLETNCPRFLLETSRGHRDTRHEEPLIVANPNQELQVFFYPTAATFALEVSKLPPSSPGITLRDHTGAVVLTQAPNAEQTVEARLPADPDRQPPWQMTIPAGGAVVNLDHLTRWGRLSEYRDHSLWTYQRNAWFDFFSNRKLLVPYRHAQYLKTGETAAVTFTVNNRGKSPKQVRLALEFPPGAKPFTTLRETTLEIPAEESRPVTLECAAPPAGETWNCRLRATTDGFTTFSSLVIKHGRRDQLYDFTTPLVLTPYNHENEQFAYVVDYPLGGQPYFDMENRPVIYADNRIHTWREGAWRQAVINLADNQKDNTIVRARITKIAFDRDNWYYTIASDLNGKAVLLYSSDCGQTFAAAPLPIDGTFDIEQFSGHNLPSSPPPMMCHTVTERDPQRIWRRVNDVKLLLPKKDGDKIVLPEPIMLTRSGIGYSGHSGMPSSIVSRGDNVHLIWAEATDPADKTIRGVPTYTATYDRSTGALSQPALIGYGPPANDIHNTPCITMDSKGYLHALVGTHGNTFLYARSLQPNTAAQGWTEAAPLGERLPQTYVGLVCDLNDILHVVFRLSRPPEKVFPDGVSPSLSLMSKPAMADAWSEPRQLVLSAFTDYSVYYHRLTIDRGNRIFLSYDYYTTYWFYRSDQAKSRRALMMSADGGQTWRLASDQDLREL